MKNRLYLFLGIIILIISGCGKKVSEEESTIHYTFMWEGLICDGVYSGQLTNGSPDGQGNFEGHLIENGEETDEISYSGSWEAGKLSGKGTLINKTENLEFYGQFQENKKKGSFKVVNVTEDTYQKVSYKADMPYGVIKKYDLSDNCIGYDRYYMGMLVSELTGDAEEISYEELLFHVDSVKYDIVKIKGTVVKKRLKNNMIMVKLEDDKGNGYILKYGSEYNSVPDSFMPDVEIGDDLLLYGYADGIGKYENEENMIMEYPMIEPITAVKNGAKELDCSDLEYSYEKFLDYPYEYKDTKVHIEGTVTGIEIEDEKKVFCQVVSSAYTGGEEAYYICQYDASKQAVPLVGDEIQVDGVLRLARSYLINDDIQVYPKIVVK